MSNRIEYLTLFNLHSIMYLLILFRFLEILFSSSFTFHNVSINSQISFQYLSFFFPFTFHNVSINSRAFEKCCCFIRDLHSIMYLLIQKGLSSPMSDFMYLHSIMYLLIRNCTARSDPRFL